MNRLTIVEQDGRPRLDILVDDRRLVEHFVGRRGAHPSEVSSIGWRSEIGAEQETIEQLLAVRRSVLVSGRVPVLVCEECGDLACGALAVRIERCAATVRWTDWAYENGYEPAKPLDWPIHPETFEFDLVEYDEALGGVASRA